MARAALRFAALGGASALAALVAAPVPAHAVCTWGRPTEAGAYFSDEIEPYSPQSLDTARLRLHFVTTGPAAVPDLAFVELAGQLGEEALDHFESLGFPPPLSDEGPGDCLAHGGDGRIDVYFVDFTAGDGQALAERCESSGGGTRCAGFVLVDAALSNYPTHDVGLRTVLVHELFHLVQQASTADMPSWLAEGTAQWAADHVHAPLTELEAFVGAYYEEAHRSIDSPPGGAAVGFSYGTAVWPVFLEQRFGVDALVALFDRLALGDEVWQATELVLGERGSSLAEAYAEIAVWHVATGARAGLGGFTDGEKYPALPLGTLGPEGVSDAFAGLGLRAYEVSSPEGVRLELEADLGRVAAFVVPLRDGLADVEARAALPVVLEPSPDDWVVVAVGTTPSKLDAPYALTLTPAPPAPPVRGGGGAGGVDSGGAGSESALVPSGPAGCALGRSGQEPARECVWMMWLAASVTRLRRPARARSGRSKVRWLT